MNPIVSVIIPVYNTEKYLNKCLVSVVNQTYRNFELIIIDDGSTDGSQKICDDFAVQDDRITVIHQNNSGVSSARNVGIKVAKAEWIMFVDSDDVLELNALEVLLSNADKFNAQMLFASGYRKYGADENIIYSSQFDFFVYQVQKYGKKIFNACFSGVSCIDSVYSDEERALEFLFYPVMKIYKRDCIKTLFNEKLSWGEDRVFNYQFVSACDTIVYVNIPIYHYNKRSDSVCNEPHLKAASYSRFAVEAENILVDALKDTENKIVWNVHLCELLFNLARTFAMSVSSVFNVKRYALAMKSILEIQQYRKALSDVNVRVIQGFNRKIIVSLLKKEFCYAVVFYLYVYFSIFPQKNLLQKLE